MKFMLFAAFIAQTLLVAETRTVVVMRDIVNPDSIDQPYIEYFKVFTQSFAKKLHEYSEKISVPYDVKVILTLKKERDGVIIHINGLGNFKQPHEEFVRPFLGMKIAEPVIVARGEVNGIIAADLVKQALVRDGEKGVPKKRAAGAIRRPFLLSSLGKYFTAPLQCPPPRPDAARGEDVRYTDR